MNKLLYEMLQKQQDEKEQEKQLEMAKTNEVIYKPNEGGFYSMQVMYMISNVMAGGELIATDDRNKTFIFTNKEGKKKNHIINIKAFNKTSEELHDLATFKYKNIIEILESNEIVRFIRRIGSERVLTTIDANGKAYDETIESDTKTCKDFGTI